MSNKIFSNNALLQNRAKILRQQMSDAEQCLWEHLRAKRLQGYKFRRQQPIGNYIVDFVCTHPPLIIGADGGQHNEQVTYDTKRSADLHALGFTALRYWNHDILQQTKAVLTDIARHWAELEK